MALKKFCARCNKLIDSNQRFCEEHQRQSEESLKNRHREYRQKRSDYKEQSFYTSKAWEQLKIHLAIKYKNICIYSYFIENKIVPVGTYHHIIPLKDDWNLRLSINNIIPLSNRIHQKIHKLYEIDKENTQQILKDLLKRWESEINASIIK